MKGYLTIISLLISSFSWLYAIPIRTDFHIKIDQFGYRPEAAKVAIISQAVNGFNAPDAFIPGAEYEVREWNSDQIIYSGNLTPWKEGEVHQQSGDKVWWFDFSEVKNPGSYYIYDPENQVGSVRFEIAENVYQDVLVQAVRTYFFQRCGFAKEFPYADPRWVDAAAYNHQNQDPEARLITDQFNNDTKRDLSGGWFDAGDYTKYVNFTHSVIHNLLFAYAENPEVWGDNFNIPESGNGIPDILDELKWELDWLLKMQLADGSVLMKVGEPDNAGQSPPSSDTGIRYYGPANSSSTRTFASTMAHASLVYQSLEFTEMKDYGVKLLEAAEKAWQWLESNPATQSYDNQGFSSANPDRSAYDQLATQFSAAVYLFDATDADIYHDYVKSNYQNIHAISWTFWYPFEQTYQDALLYYTQIDNADAGISSEILTNFESSISSNNADLVSALSEDEDAYHAYIKDNDYVWGSNQVKSQTGNILYNAYHYDILENRKEDLLRVSEGYIHYLHGVNPMSMVFLSNMGYFGAENYVNEIYHQWFADDTEWDHALNSAKGPAPGYLTGGPNREYSPAEGVIAPPQNQPIQKSYKDWNTVWPDKSWEITEPAIYYQAAYIKLLSKFVHQNNQPASHQATPRNFNATIDDEGKIHLSWYSSSEVNNRYYVIFRSENEGPFSPVDTIESKNQQAQIIKYESLDQSDAPLIDYYVSQIDLDNSEDKSHVQRIMNPLGLGNEHWQDLVIYPNPFSREIRIQNSKIYGDRIDISLFSMEGSLILNKSITSAAPEETINIPENLKSGVYIMEISHQDSYKHRKLIIKK